MDNNAQDIGNSLRTMKGGALGMVLFVSRVVGVAPFLRGAEYRVSLPLLIFAKLFILITALDFIIMCATYSNFYHQKFESLVAIDILTTTSKFVAILVTFVSVLHSPKRTMRMLQSLEELDQIDRQILGDLPQHAREMKLTVLIFLYLHLSVGLRGYYMTTGQLNETTLNFFILITYYMINLSELQVTLFARRTMFSLKVLNESLQRLRKSITSPPIKDISSQILSPQIKHATLAWEPMKEQSLNLKSKPGRLVKKRPEQTEAPVKLIRRCLVNYLRVCDLIAATMDGDGFFIVILLMRNVLSLLTHAYRIMLYSLATGTDFTKPNIAVAICWCVIYSVSLIVFIEPYHKTQSEMQKLQFLLMYLKLSNQLEKDVDNELHLFGRIVNTNKPKYSPLGMFTLNRLLVVKVFGSLHIWLSWLPTDQN